MRDRRPFRIVAMLIALAVLVATIARLSGSGAPVATSVLYIVVASVYLGVGTLLVERLPRHPVGPIIVAFGGIMAFYIVGDALISRAGDTPSAAVIAWAVSLIDGPMFALVALLFLVFPDGHLPSPRWRVVVWFDVAAAAAVVLGVAVKPGPMAAYPDLSNPFGAPGSPLVTLWEPAYLLLIGSVALSASSLVGRWRRGGILERAQLKWVAAAATLIALAMGGYAAVIGPGKFNNIADLAIGLAFAFFPIAVAIAILRYRLFEIDRVVSRTIGYVVITAILIGAYAAVILLLQGPLGTFTGGDTVAVALSTLVAAALFQPLRGLVQSVVDRRFDRARFDAERTTSAFSARLRSEVDMEAVTGDLTATVRSALRPTSSDLWLRGGPNR